MQSLEFLQEFYVPVVMGVCLSVGYILKHWTDDVDNKIIPTVLAVLGAVCACVNARDISLQVITAGMVTGLASTGLHQAFSQWVKKE